MKWNRNRQTFCAYVRYRQGRRRLMVATALAFAATPLAERLAQRLAASWRVRVETPKREE